MANFGWALLTLASPVAVSAVSTVPGVSTEPGGFILPLPLMLIPLVAIRPLRKAKAAGILHSRSFEARYGWLCSRCDTIAFF